MTMKLRRTPTHLLTLGLGASLLLGACGQGTIDLGAGGLRKPTPIHVINGGAGNPAAGTASGAADSRMAGSASEMSIAPMAPVEFVLGDVGALPTNTTGYVLPAGAEVTADRVARVAGALGVSGEPMKGAAGSGSSWQVGPTDGSGPTFNVSVDAQLSWWYSSAFAADAVASCAVAVAPDGTRSTDDCAEPTPPAGILSSAQAEAKARKLLGDTGEDLSGLTVTANADEWSANVDVVAPLDSFDSPVRWSLSFGENGALQYASGMFARPEKVGPYPLVDLGTAFARLKEQSAYPMGSAGFGGAEGGVARSVDSATATETVASVETAPVPTPAPVPAPVPGVPATIEPGDPTTAVTVVPGPGEDLPSAEPITVELVGVEADLWWAWDSDGSVWLLPAYRFNSADGGNYVVPAVTDEFLIETGERPASSPGSEGSGVVGVSPNRPVNPIVESPVFDSTRLESSIGLGLAEFTEVAKSMGAGVRVGMKDGVDLPVTADYSSSRVTVAVSAGRVTAILGVG